MRGCDIVETSRKAGRNCPRFPTVRNFTTWGRRPPPAAPLSLTDGDGHARAPLRFCHFSRSHCRGGILALETHEGPAPASKRAALGSARSTRYRVSTRSLPRRSILQKVAITASQHRIAQRTIEAGRCGSPCSRAASLNLVRNIPRCRERGQPSKHAPPPGYRADGFSLSEIDADADVTAP